MDPRDNNPRKERDDTDARLLAERAKTDDQLAKKKSTSEMDADHIVEVARDLADATLLAARNREDRATPDPAARREDLELERAAEDGVVAKERVVADERLLAEREKSQRALAALLRLEREATDDGLLVERTRADAAVATRDDFLGMVSHDLRSMLGGIALGASMLAKQASREGKAGAATLQQTERIQRFTARMNRLLGDLLDVVGLEAGKLHVTMSPDDPAALVREAVEAFQPSFAVKGVTLTADVAVDSVAVSLDHERILQVLANLLSNALKFTPRGGHVVVSVAKTAAEVRFSVKDTGIGIPASQSAAIFERFWQVAAHDRRGLGLGLYIAKSILDAHGGSVWAESPEGGGALIHFTLPLAAAAPDAAH